MRPPGGLNDDEALAPIELLLRDAAEFEPDEPAPGLLTAGGVALLLADDAARRRRTVRARISALAGVLTGAAACSASLVLALNQPRQQSKAPRPAMAQVSQQAPAPQSAKNAVADAVQLAPRPRTRTVSFTRRGARRHPRAVRLEAPHPVWTEETVERQVTGVLAQAWLVQSQEDGSFEVTPTLVDVPLSREVAACEPGMDAASKTPAPTDSNVEEPEAR